MTWYRGDCHVHSALSRGADRTPGQIAAEARENGLAFIVVTEHDAAAPPGAWEPLAGDDLLVIPGQEAVTRTGHWLALGLGPGQVIGSAYGVRDDAIGRHTGEVHRAGGLCVAAHPHAPYPRGAFMYPFDGFDAIEVWNGQWSSDIHLAGQMGTHTVVRAAELGARAILDGLRTGRSWIAGSPSVHLSLDVSAAGRAAGIGERLDTGGEPALVRVTVTGVPSGTVSFHTERGTVHREPLPSDGHGTVEWRTTAEESSFVRVEVRHPGRHAAALANPVVLG